MSTLATSALLRFARRWFDERTVANVFEPLLADHQREWLDAAPAWRVRVAMRTAIAFIIAMLAVAPRTLFLTPTPPAITRRVIARVIIFTSVMTALQFIPIWREVWQAFAALGVEPARGAAWLWLLPSMVLLALPFSVGFAVDGVRRRSTPTAAERLSTLRTAILSVAVIVIAHGWIVPETNQQFRLAVWGDRLPPPARGVRELTTPELITAPSLARAEGPHRVGIAQRELHNRAAFALLPVVLIWTRWRAINRQSSQWLVPAWLSAGVAVVVWGVVLGNSVRIESLLGLSPGLGAWAPLVILLGAAWVADRARGRSPLATLQS